MKKKKNKFNRNFWTQKFLAESIQKIKNIYIYISMKSI